MRQPRWLPDDLCEEFPVAAGRILGGEFNIRGIFTGISRHFADSGQDLVRRHPQLVLHMQRARGQEQMDARVRRVLDGVPGGVNVLDCRPGQGGNGAILDLPGDGLAPDSKSPGEAMAKPASMTSTFSRSRH